MCCASFQTWCAPPLHTYASCLTTAAFVLDSVCLLILPCCVSCCSAEATGTGGQHRVCGVPKQCAHAAAVRCVFCSHVLACSAVTAHCIMLHHLSQRNSSCWSITGKHSMAHFTSQACPDTALLAFHGCWQVAFICYHTAFGID